MAGVVRLGDPHSHGGQVVQASGKNIAAGLGVARLGDAVVCYVHGSVNIAGGCSGTVATDGLPTAKDGCVTSCGATVYSTYNTIQVGG